MPPASPSPAAAASNSSPTAAVARGTAGRAQVLAAAAELFTRDGYAATTTRAVAERAGLRQSTLYHHFASKDAILATLLEGTVTPALAHANRLLETAEPVPGARLWSMVHFDTALLLGGFSNLGALYLLPEVRGERFADFRRLRCELGAAYRTLLAGLDGLPASELTLRAELVLGLVEGTVAVSRQCAEHATETVCVAVADAAVRLACGAGCPPERLTAIRTAARGLPG
ncbi:TetR/AcrR family transcriptional regulator [Kitasatospora sp. NBC_01250]|uniref:TetR/AcrR family transcriptional regulator n=1 Tax=Kitasatospora sp. NBC_01250 TaxID=2903571 RepID=UPI002E370326|nr:helix-turn-helix domain-containing protein [Kitasatospora sp. NBC_01250]